MKVIIQPGKIKGTVTAPPSKSYAHRMLICAALADGISKLKGISLSEDMLATLDCVHALGASWQREGDLVTIAGIGRCAERLPLFPCRESGSTLRFFIPVSLAVCEGGVFTGTDRLMERGIGIYEELFQDTGIQVQQSAEIRVSGSLKPGDYQVRGDVSSQFITGLLFALTLLDEDSRIRVLAPVESRAYIDITMDTMQQFGIHVREVSPNCFQIPRGQRYQPRNLEVEGDWSNAAFLYAFRAAGHDLQIRGVNENSIQGDKACVDFLEQLAMRKRTGGLRAEPINISNTPDLGPVLFAAAAALGGGHFTGTRRLRIKESDRAAAMKEELEKFGITCHVSDNEVVVEPGVLRKPEVPLKGHNDHRIVMALSVLASLTGAQIEDAQAVSKSWPDYFEIMKKAGLDVSFV